MCGIFGYIGAQEASPLIMEGLSRLEYRGYDSTGLAVITGDGHLGVRKSAGKLPNLANLVQAKPLHGVRGIGHTRWATHGGPTDANAHPHTNPSNSIVVVHNGIVENYRELKERFLRQGHSFISTTDSEVIPHLIQEHLEQGVSFPEAVRLTARELGGAHAIACLSTDDDSLVALRMGNAGGLSVGYGHGEMFISSDLSSLIPLTRSVVYLPPNQIAVLHPTGCTYMDIDGQPIDKQPDTVAANVETATKEGYPHFTLKEITEQPEAALNTLRGRLAFNPLELTMDEVRLSPQDIRALNRVVFVAMGTSLHAAEVGARLMERLARLPATAENASEFRYRQPVLDEHTLVVSVGQSGETADTLEAMARAKAEGARLLTICNVEGSQATYAAEGTMLMHAGPEIGVASSKTFTNSMVCLYLLALHLGEQRIVLEQGSLRTHLESLTHLPALLGRTLELNQEEYPRLGQRYSKFRRFMFIGRGLMEPIAREGAMKFKEISYIHAEGLPAAELKHGPIALIDPETPTVAIVLQDSLYDKMLGNISEVHSRSGPVLAIATEGDQHIAKVVDDVLWVPACPPEIAPIIGTLPLQLFAYHTAVYLGNDVDQPRNLAKSVTVE